MLVVMSNRATPEEIDAVVAAIEVKGYTARPIPGGERVAIGVLHNKGAVETSRFLGLPGVNDVIPVTRPYKLVSREFQPEDTVIQLGDARVGSGSLTLIAGPCAVESEEQCLTIARGVKAAGAQLFRGGASNPEPLHIHFKVWAKKGSGSWRGFGKTRGCLSLLKPWILTTLVWWKSMLT